MVPNNSDYYMTHGATPSPPLSGWFLDGNFQKTTGAGITSVTITVWPAAGPRSRQRAAGSTPVINAAAGSYQADGEGKTEYLYQPTQADGLAMAPGWYVFQWTINSTGGKVDIYPDNEQLGTWYVAAAIS